MYPHTLRIFDLLSALHASEVLSRRRFVNSFILNGFLSWTVGLSLFAWEDAWRHRASWHGTMSRPPCLICIMPLGPAHDELSLCAAPPLRRKHAACQRGTWPRKVRCRCNSLSRRTNVVSMAEDSGARTTAERMDVDPKRFTGESKSIQGMCALECFSRGCRRG